MPEMSTTTAYPTRHLRHRAAAFALLARLLGDDVSALVDGDTVASLRRALDDAGDIGTLGRLADLESELPADPVKLAGTWVRWFDLGRVVGYEGSNIPSSAGGVTPRLADIAGFYSAFGLAVSRERPDHIVAELEFMSFLLLSEAEARTDGEPERAEIAADAARVFLRDHLGTWVTAWASRVGEVDQLAPWFPVAAAAAELVASECRERNVIPLRLSPVLPADRGVAPPDEAILNC
jgi:nitrate reductase assembly molybdenum cofactor insertion protein NarJ